MGIDYRDFRAKYKKAESTLYGPVNLTKLFRRDGNDSDTKKMMKVLFKRMFTAILRKSYLMESLKVGKMRDL